jgi:serine/threonine-protein kinase
VTLLNGKYELLSPIASGGMASVHLGRVVGMAGFERLVAIKRMHPHLLEETEYITMFLDEARLAARIRHPNVVATLDVAESEEGPFIVMEFIDGPPLSQLLKAHRKRDAVMPLDIALGIFSDTMTGLHAAHELRGADGEPLNLVHRDVSPQNIMVGRDGVARITDFGVAKANVRLSSTRSGFLKGKLAYIAPEQVRGEALDRRADVYAAGVVLWEILTSHRLFRAETEANLMWMLMQGADRSPREANPDVPEAIDAVCMKALAMEPEARFATAAEFEAAIEDAAESCGIRIAKARRVTELIEALNLPTPSANLPPTGRGAMTTVSSPSGRAQTPLSSPRTPAPSSSASVRTEAAVASPIEGSTSSDSRGGRVGMIGGALAIFALGVGAAVLVMDRGTASAPTAASPSDPAEANASDEKGDESAASDEAPNATADATVSPEVEPTSEPTVEPSAQPSTQPGVAATTVTRPPASPHAPPAVPGPPAEVPRPASPPPPTSPPTGPNADYQPEGL